MVSAQQILTCFATMTPPSFFFFVIPSMRVRLIQAFGFLCEETCIILYWLGLWSLLNMTPLLTSVGFNVFCLLAGAGGLFIVKAFTPALILNTAEATGFNIQHLVPTPQNMKRMADLFIREHHEHVLHGANVRR